MVFLLEILACVTILNSKMYYHRGIYFQSGVSQLEKYGPYRYWTVDYNGRAESQNGRIYCFLDTLDTLSNVNTLLASLATWSKNVSQVFERWSSNRVIERDLQEGSNFKAEVCTW